MFPWYQRCKRLIPFDGRDPVIANKSGEYAIKRNDEIVKKSVARKCKYDVPTSLSDRVLIKPSVVEVGGGG